MPAKKDDKYECMKYKSKALIMLGLLLIAYGAMRYYGISMPVSLMTVGALLVLKGIIIKLKKQAKM